MNTESKILKRTEASLLVKTWKEEGKKVVFTNGCFDLLHLGHVDYLEKARNFGDKMVVGVNTNASVSKLKGPSRPICPEYSRLRVLASLAFVDAVVLFDEETPLELIETLSPNILVKGSDYEIKDIVGAKHVFSTGGQVKTVELVEGFSTSNIISKIKSE